ncbi:MAG: hypothetical protein ACOCVI_02915 [Planctomycetota bacterium]
MRKAIIAVALLSLLAGSVQAKSYNMIGWWQEDQTGSPFLAAAAAVDGDVTKSNFLIVEATPGSVTTLSDSLWTHETQYTLPAVVGSMTIMTADFGALSFVTKTGFATNLSNPLVGSTQYYHPSEFLFTMDIIEFGTTNGAGGTEPLEGTLTATWSNNDAPLQTYDSAGLVYGVGPEFSFAGPLPDLIPEGYGLNVLVDIPGIPEDAIIPEPVTMLAAGAGLMGLGGYIRRRRRG